MSLTFTATVPTLGVVSAPLQPHHQHPDCSAGLLGEGQREEGMHATTMGKGWAVGETNRVLCRPGCP